MSLHLTTNHHPEEIKLMSFRRRFSRSTIATVATMALVTLAGCSGHPRSFSGGGGDESADGSGSGGKTITVAMIAGWDEDVASTYLWQELMSRHGYTMNIRELDVASTFTGVAQGQVDMYLDAWLPTTHEAYWSKYQNKLEVVGTWASGRNMLVVPNYVQAKSISDLTANPSLYNKQVIGIEAGSGLMGQTRKNVFPQYGLNSDFSLVEGSSAAMLAALESATKQKKPIVVTLWQPHWAFAKYPIRALSDPKGAYGKPDNLQVVATKGFSQKYADLAGWMKKFKLTNAQLSSLTLAVHNGGKGNEKASVQKWITANKPLVDSWFA